MSLPYSIAAVLASAITTLSILYQVYLWQRKEYRWDRVRSYLFSPEAANIYNSWIAIALACLIAGWIFYFQILDILATSAGYLGLLVLFGFHLYRVRSRGLYRPDPTPKGYLTLATLTILTICLFALLLRSGYNPVLELLTAIFYIPILGIFAVYIVNGITYPKKQAVIKRAHTLRKQSEKCQVVVITGSVGKTSTKEFLYQLLKSAGENVIATKEHRNSEFTVAQDVIEQFPTQADYYVVEAAAYRRGEIDAIAQLVVPEVAAITAIHNQHASLFGSPENIITAKWELVNALPKNGVAVLNADDPIIVAQAKHHSGKVIWFSVASQADVYAESVTYTPYTIECRIHIGEYTDTVQIPLIGKGALISVIAALATGMAAGVRPSKLCEAISDLKPIARTMEIQDGRYGVTIIDDSYSTSELAAQSALEQFRRMPQKDKRIIFVPIIELGQEGPSVHARLGKQFATSGASVYIFGNAYKRDIMKGAAEDASLITWFTEPGDLLSAIVHNVTSDTAILIEGRVPAVVHKGILL